MPDTSLAQLSAGKYLLVSTYRKDGTLVPTPVWVVEDGDALGIWTPGESWKVKRIRGRADVMVGPCDRRGRPTGEQVPATAEICPPDVTARYRTLILHKYGVPGFLTLFGSRIRRGLKGTVGVRITLTP
ncbi:PPOX class F420-dependent oxidoreductase [Streptomyces venezuelae]|uniref:PPOX class F420-dependent oxidoreductase n=1 Tax=Streptomyces venezuelae TaxID=54571 RepID=A0A5P2CWU3_STRVZ|nr:PPOX class F420-dependent oxidoreductase [Streptomyces venezuelae]QES45581.1 PPOX class F420-dependent oxidoreductase [Streptomyces venezuelae]